MSMVLRRRRVDSGGRRKYSNDFTLRAVMLFRLAFKGLRL